MAENNKSRKVIKSSRKIALKPNLKNRKASHTSENPRNLNKMNYQEILDKFTNKFAIK
jgi:hypothetical protein